MQLMPAGFKTHPVPFEGHVTVEAPGDAIVAGLPDPWIHFDEFYTFHQRPEDLGVHVLLALDEATMPAEPADAYVGYHPIAWTQPVGATRVFYNALGHTDEVYGEPLFLGLLERGIAWAGMERHAARCDNRSR